MGRSRGVVSFWFPEKGASEGEGEGGEDGEGEGMMKPYSASRKSLLCGPYEMKISSPGRRAAGVVKV